MSAVLSVSPLVMRVLDRSACEGSVLILPEQLDVDLYRAVDRILRAAGGRWDRRAGGHRFPGDAGAAIEPILLTGRVGDVRSEFGQFDTPAAVAVRVLDEARVVPGMRVLEPSAGLGNLAVPAIGAGALVTTHEIDPTRAARLIMRISALAHPAARESMGRCGDFLALAPDPVFDRVLMNPPFAGQADIRHVTHASGFLRPGGRLVAIMSESVTFRRNARAEAFRAFLAERRARVEPLGPDAFRESGTAVRSVLVSFDRSEGDR